MAGARVPRTRMKARVSGSLSRRLEERDRSEMLVRQARDSSGSELSRFLDTSRILSSSRCEIELGMLVNLLVEALRRVRPPRFPSSGGSWEIWLLLILRSSRKGQLQISGGSAMIKL
eukprot:484099-Hanusia_phi.AAC.2